MRNLKITNQITKRETVSFSKYLRDVNQLGDLLTADEEAELGFRIKQGDPQAEKILVEKNLKFVISVAKQYSNNTICSLEDLVSEGNIGLIKAAKRFDFSMGNKFISYAVWWIRQSIVGYLTDNARTIRLPLNKIGQLNKIKKSQESFSQTHSRQPTTEELIDFIGKDFKPEDIELLVLSEKNAISLNSGLPNRDGAHDDFTLEDLITDSSVYKTDEKLDTEDVRKVVSVIVNRLSKRHRAVIEMYYGLNGHPALTLDEISNQLGLSRERIRQMKKSAIYVLKNPRNKELVKPYLK